ncbi:hypothetical protein IMG5_121950 [Ichthyophthirius multifiliis]|uniref:Uncharacterized protein n=1 Tax=Ichthyophthirius multifiliis TaxID=5932 RepID=G0QV80_ICHMU|nr:hypothetical protein IMG5_121950 [Ichthyophthirius multifiliis]EGR30864.1 hypothetical protein IMG5_121950 [Ichthyophthirius multifiliis]|eukprot:XP_004032451.1 hypothetical protein IMG5_121950 [Ichthyophthirius multifiliis]
MINLLNERKQLFDKLEQAVQSKDDLQISCIVDSLRLRLGLSGKTRNQALYSFFDEIVKLLMPFHMKYLLYIAQESIYFYNLIMFDFFLKKIWKYLIHKIMNNKKIIVNRGFKTYK